MIEIFTNLLGAKDDVNATMRKFLQSSDILKSKNIFKLQTLVAQLDYHYSAAFSRKILNTKWSPILPFYVQALKPLKCLKYKL